jgi:hypothetical protein
MNKKTILSKQKTSDLYFLLIDEEFGFNYFGC